MCIGIIVNETKDPNFEYVKDIVNFIISQNITPLLLDSYKSKIDNKNILFLGKNELFKRSKFIIIIGGDGTILQWSTEIAEYKKEILGINKGNLGYLTDVEPNQHFEAIKKVLDNKYKTEKRMMLSISINDNSYLALNEVSIHSENTGRMIEIGVEINFQKIDKINADGIIISTPTGSTAYNLSAGGPILKPDLEIMVITYVCPHAIFSRPYVISAEDEVNLCLPQKNARGYLSLDGKSNILIEHKDKILIKKSIYETNIIKTSNLNFYDILKNKMIKKK